MTFFETMEECMRERGMTYADLSRITGFYPAYFSKLKRGQAKDVTWERGVAIIKALGMTPNEFVARMNEDAPAPFIAEG